MKGLKVAAVSASFFASTAAQPTPLLGVNVNQDTGEFIVSVQGEEWFPSAPPTMQMNGQPATLTLQRCTTGNGTEALGEFQETSCLYSATAASVKIPLVHSIKHFAQKAIILFSQQFPQGAPGTAFSASFSDADRVGSSFPSLLFSDLPSQRKRGYASWSGVMVDTVHFGSWDNQTAELNGGRTGGIFTVYDEQAKASLFVSAASNFMTANFETIVETKSSNSLRMGTLGTLTSFPVGYEMSFIMAASADGVNAAAQHWGDSLLTLHGKGRETREQDYTLKYLGYSTDNGAFYYYHSVNETGRWKQPYENWEPTLQALVDYSKKEAIPYRYILLDSWWYPKDPGTDGVLTWTADPSVFPNGLEHARQVSDWPIQGHNRYWSSNTPYASANGGSYNFVLEKDKGKAIPVEQRFWDDLLENSTKWGLINYEQDWLCTEFDGLNVTLQSPTVARQWLLQMGQAAAENDLTIQYCMAYARHILQSVEVQAVTNFRASGDYQAGNDQWKLGLSSILANALALAPSKDNYWTTTTQPGSDWPSYTEPYNQLQGAVSSLTRGPVAPSDKVGASDTYLISRHCDLNGRLLRPSVSATSIDATFAFRSFGKEGPDGEVWQSHSLVGGKRYMHVLAAQLNADYHMPLPLMPDDHPTDQVVWESRNGKVYNVTSWSKNALIIRKCGKADFQMYHSSPFLPFSNEIAWALLGETSKWVPISPDRITSVSASDASGSLSVALMGTKGEAVELTFVKQGQESHLVVGKCILPSSGAATMVLNIQSSGITCV